MGVKISASLLCSALDEMKRGAGVCEKTCEDCAYRTGYNVALYDIAKRFNLPFELPGRF